MALEYAGLLSWGFDTGLLVPSIDAYGTHLYRVHKTHHRSTSPNLLTDRIGDPLGSPGSTAAFCWYYRALHGAYLHDDVYRTDQHSSWVCMCIRVLSSSHAGGTGVGPRNGSSLPPPRPASPLLQVELWWLTPTIWDWICGTVGPIFVADFETDQSADQQATAVHGGGTAQ